MAMVYKFREGARVSGDAQTVGEALAGINERHGRLEAPTVVEEARPDASPLHRYFEWDDRAAAEQYRVSQARHLIAAVVVSRDNDAPPVPAFVNVKVSGPRLDVSGPVERDEPEGADGEGVEIVRAYVPVARVMADEDLRRQALQAVCTEIGGLQRKLAALNAFAQELETLESVKVQIAAKI